MSYHLCKNYKDFQKVLALQRGDRISDVTLEELRKNWAGYPEWLPTSFPCVVEWYYVSEDETDDAWGIGWWHRVLTLAEIQEEISKAREIMKWEKYF